MRLPLSWLRDFVPYDGSVEDLVDRLGTSGFEIDGIHRIGAVDREGNHERFVIGRVVDFVKHPNADRLRLCRVDTGDDAPRQIVCGASNFAVGDAVVVALPGAVLPGSDAPLKRAKLRGEISDGMMLSERELGLSDEHDGIIVLPSGAAYPVGSLLRDHVELDETVLELAVESNRGDCLSVYGMAREVAVLFDLTLAPIPGKEPAATGQPVDELVTVAIEATDRCARFTARGFVDVVVGPSPLRVRQRLAAAGIRPISNVVDATNYVMHELGNPLHVYDADCIAGGVLTARLALAREEVRTLDGRERQLTPDTLVIADAEGATGIAGIMGGLASEVTDRTTKVVLEAACFERGGIQRASKALGLRTDGSNRWEKGVSPHLAPIASIRAAELISAWCGATMLAGSQDVITGLPEAEVVTLRKRRPREILGLEVANGEVGRILAGLGFEPAESEDEWTCTVPWWRWLDATREVDLVEEIGRIHGLDHVPAHLPRIEPGRGGLTHEQRVRRRIEDHLAGAGLREVVTLSLVDPLERARYGLDGVPAVSLRNPLSSDLSELRVSLAPSLLEVVRRNRAVGRRDVQAFEIGGVHRAGSDAASVIEDTRVGLILSGHVGGGSWLGEGPPADFGSMVAVTEALLVRLGIAARRVREADCAFLHPGRAARMEAGGEVLGFVGELHPAIALETELDGPVSLAELDLGALARAVARTSVFDAVSPFPPVRQDIAVVVPCEVEAASLIDTAHQSGGPLVAGVDVFDVFADPERLGSDRVSVALHLRFQAADRTLTDDEATEVRERIVDALVQHHGAELRG